MIAAENFLVPLDDTTDNSPVFLTSEDFFCVDQHKMGQVVRNLISNAIKFTPGGKSVIIKIRKSSPLAHTSERSESPRVLQHSNYDFLPGLGGGRLGAYGTPSPGPIVRSWTASRGSKGHSDGDCSPVDIENGPFLMFTSNVTAESDSYKHKAEMADYGYLVLEVIDAGVGMQPEDSKRIFKEVGKGPCIVMVHHLSNKVIQKLTSDSSIFRLIISVIHTSCLSFYSIYIGFSIILKVVQFTPSELQAGGGSGLGMMITKALVDLHRGHVSVRSDGLGLGSTFTLKIPLSSPPPLSLSYPLQS